MAIADGARCKLYADAGIEGGVVAHVVHTQGVRRIRLGSSLSLPSSIRTKASFQLIERASPLTEYICVFPASIFSARFIRSGCRSRNFFISYHCISGQKKQDDFGATGSPCLRWACSHSSRPHPHSTSGYLTMYK